jgi:hypothetical protein
MFTQYSQTWWEGCFCYNSVTTDGFITDIEDLENKFLTLPRNEITLFKKNKQKTNKQPLLLRFGQ